MSNWQYLVQGSWIPLNPNQQKKLDKRHECPTLDPIRLKTDFGMLTGIPEAVGMKFKIHGDSEFQQSKIRRGPRPGEKTIIEVVDGNYPRILSQEAAMLACVDSKRNAELRDIHLALDEIAVNTKPIEALAW